MRPCNLFATDSGYFDGAVGRQRNHHRIPSKSELARPRGPPQETINQITVDITVQRRQIYRIDVPMIGNHFDEEVPGRDTRRLVVLSCRAVRHIPEHVFERPDTVP